ncbi:MAG: FHA domain-containing protein [Planctomycetota bacterium]|jgi:pSer/pThr/pTyr-binding forkhead associated (FHA) protein
MGNKSNNDFGTDRVAKPTVPSAEATQQSPALAAMVHVFNGQEIKVYPMLGVEYIIGRVKSCHIQVTDDSSISRQHARIYRQGVVFLVEDLGSSNGTLLNGKEVSRPTELRVGDEVEVGSQKFRFKRQA